MARTLFFYGTLILIIVITFILYNRMLGAIPLLLVSFILYYMAYLESKKEQVKRKLPNDKFVK
ncbi:hypothetical protein E2R51_09885 [Jeotgalibacillus sp. S-D1]|uniref:hypothetical protein n=1 Tax=Jeotgalibacillus sp. S-D1 TaxID=2552189 RepID=UPI001059C79A|nr:hypothetical protein [Jeotgalibacillus sp. S-D1]TDL32962.1 hypothetical protein E2R51_09885 [Jeotgalibacillus sp. S-D1]